MGLNNKSLYGNGGYILMDVMLSLFISILVIGSASAFLFSGVKAANALSESYRQQLINRNETAIIFITGAVESE